MKTSKIFKSPADLVATVTLNTKSPKINLDFAKVIEGLESCLQFSNEEEPTSDVLIRLFEQAINIKTACNPAEVSTPKIVQFLEGLLKKMLNERYRLEGLTQDGLQDYVQKQIRNFFSNLKWDVSNRLLSNPAEQNDISRVSSTKDVNEILVKIEMKRFQKIIDNRMQHRNSLLVNDVKRCYPLSVGRVEDVMPNS